MLLPDILYLAFLSLVVIYADFKMTKGNWGAKWNGIGAIPDILDGTAKIPMRHRVLIAWICRLVEICKIEQRPFLNTYVYIRWFAITLSLVATDWYFLALGLKPLLPVSILACVFVLSSLYDYTDMFLEVACFAVFLRIIQFPIYGDYLWIPLVLFLSTLNRETTVFLVPLAFIFGDNAMGALAAGACMAGWLIPRIVYLDGERYCSAILIKENLRLIRSWRERHVAVLYDEYTLFFLLFLVTGILYVVTAFHSGLDAVEFVMAVFFLAMLVPSMWREIRVFAPTTLVTIPMAMGLLQ